MTQLEGLKNFSLNIKHTMMAIHKDKVRRLSDTEANNIVQFYLEVLDYLSKQEE